MPPKKSTSDSSKSLFDHISDVTFNKTDWHEDHAKTFDTYMINRFLSMDMNLIELVDSIQMYTTGLPLDKKLVHKIYTSYIPKKKFYSKYIKSTTASKYPPEVLKIFTDTFSLGTKDVTPVIDRFISDGNSIAKLLKSFGYDEKQIKKIIKKIDEA